MLTAATVAEIAADSAIANCHNDHHTIVTRGDRL
jgi:hypothetical protein